MNTQMLLMAGAVTVGVTGAVTDVISRRIPNKLTYAAIIVAIVGRFALEGWSGLGSALAGGLVGGGAFLVFFLLHTMGAGDVKLITAVCCFVGPGMAFEIVLASAIAGGVFALVLALWKRRLRTVLANSVDLVRFHAAVGAEMHPSLNLSNPEAIRMPYGVAIAAGVLYSVLAFYHRGGI